MGPRVLEVKWVQGESLDREGGYPQPRSDLEHGGKPVSWGQTRLHSVNGPGITPSAVSGTREEEGLSVCSSVSLFFIYLFASSGKNSLGYPLLFPSFTLYPLAYSINSTCVF